MKVEGVAKIPDYVQIRDSDFTLVAYLRLDRLEVGYEKLNIAISLEKFSGIIGQLPFGKVVELNLE